MIAGSAGRLDRSKATFYNENRIGGDKSVRGGSPSGWERCALREKRLQNKILDMTVGQVLLMTLRRVLS